MSCKSGTSRPTPTRSAKRRSRWAIPSCSSTADRYYLFGTNASNEGFKCWESTDLVHWTPKGWAYQETDDSWAKSHYWAPEVKEYRGKFYMTYSAMPKKAETPRLLIALAVSDKPEGPYKDLHAPWFDFGYSAIDGHIFVDDDGKPYLYFSRNGVQDGYSFGIIYGVALADDLSKPVGEAVKLMEADQPWEKVRYAENRCNEGAFVLKHKGRYYMTYSANHTGFPHYGIGYATADKPLGPWVKAEENPIAATNLEIGVSGPGHNSITRSPDGKEMFIVYHTPRRSQETIRRAGGEHRPAGIRRERTNSRSRGRPGVRSRCLPVVHNGQGSAHNQCCGSPDALSQNWPEDPDRRRLTE